MRPSIRIQLYASLLLAAHLVAWYGLRRFGIPYWLALGGVAAALLLAAEVLMRRPAKAKVDPFEQLNQLSNSEAERRARELLANPRKFAVTAGGPFERTAAPDLGGAAAALFRDYSSIRSVAGELHLSRELIAPSALKPGFLRIGTDIEHTEMAVMPGADPVYELDELSRGESPTPTYRTVFHLIVATDEQLYRG